MPDDRATSEASEDTRRQLRRCLECLVGVHFTEGNAVTVLRNGDEIFPAMLEAIRKARHRADAAAYPAACSMCCRRRRSGSRLSASCTTGRANLTRNWRDGPVPPEDAALACRLGVRQAGPASAGFEVIPEMAPSAL